LDTLDQEAPAYSEAESNPSKLEPNSVNTEPGVLEQQVLLQQLPAKPNKLKPAAALVDTQKQPQTLFQRHKSGQRWPQSLQLPVSSSSTAKYTIVIFAKTSSRGLAAKSNKTASSSTRRPPSRTRTQTVYCSCRPRCFESLPRPFRAVPWMKVQKAVNQSGYVFQDKRRHVHAYLIKNPRGAVGKSLSCMVISPTTCKALLPPLPQPNPMILGRV